MHDYAIDSGIRRNCTISVFCVSVIVSTLLQPIVETMSLGPLDPFLKSISSQHPLILFFRGASPLVVYTFIHLSFSRWLWKSKCFRPKWLVNLPDLNGRWTGHLRSSYGNQDIIQIEVDIRQNWDKMSIVLRTNHSVSESVIGALQCGAGEKFVLYYLYENKPKAFEASTMHSHRGTARLAVEAGELTGEYYTGRDRCTYGEIVLRKAS